MAGILGCAMQGTRLLWDPTPVGPNSCGTRLPPVRGRDCDVTRDLVQGFCFRCTDGGCLLLPWPTCLPLLSASVLV